MEDLERICHNFDMRVKDIIYFSVNNWDCGINYPDTEIFRKWLGEDEDQYFMNDEWCKENKLCVYCGIIDMSFNYTVSAPKEWVEKNCPELLTNYSDFIFLPKEGEIKPEYDSWHQPFLDYCEENFGCNFYKD